MEKKITRKQPFAKYILGDCIVEMKKIESSSIDMIFADPPYNLQLKNTLLRPDSSLVDGVNNDWDKFNSFSDYDEYTKKWLIEAKRVLKDDGTLWTIGTYHNIYRIGYILQNLEYWVLNDIIWRKTNPMPNFRGTRFTNAHETMIWASKSKNSKYKFNYRAMKSLNEDLQMRSDWLLNICSGKERIKSESNKKIHPTQKPESLLYRILLASTDPGDIILDPFFGTGTSGAVAKKLGRRFIGIEKESNYIIAAKERISKIRIAKKDEIKNYLTIKKIKRIPFGNLVENGTIKPGTRLYNLSKKIEAKVLVDGTIKHEKTIGSIHSVGAKVQSQESCNGWKYWYILKGSKLISIDEHRKDIA